MKRMVRYFFSPTIDNTTQSVIFFLKLLNMKIAVSTIRDTLWSNPNFPSLISISESLEKWGIENISLRVDTSKLDDIPIPFLAHIKNDGGFFVPVKDYSNNVITFINPKGKEKTIPKAEL